MRAPGSASWTASRLADSNSSQLLDALRRQPDTGFAIHDAGPGRIHRLLAERAELRALLQHRPPDRHPAFHHAELALESAKKELYWAHYRLDHAREHLDQLGRLSQLRRHGRREKATTVDQIGRFTDDVRRAEANIAGCEERLDQLRPELGRRLQWDVEHKFPDSRLRTLDAEITDLGEPGHRIEGMTPDRCLLSRDPGRDSRWLDRIAKVAPPRPPGPDLGAGIDFGP